MRKLALVLALLMVMSVFTACMGDDEKTDGTQNQNPAGTQSGNTATNTDEVVPTEYAIMPGDYYCVAGENAKSDNPEVVEVIKENLVRGCKPGVAKITVTSGKKTVTHTVTVVTLDNVTLGTDYKKVSQKEFQKNLDDKIATFIDQYVPYTEVTDRTDIRMGDKVSIDYVGKIGGVAFEGGTGSYDLIIGSGAFIDGFEEGLIGKEKGKTVELNLTFPNPYPNNADLAGKDVVFTVTINKITATEGLTDELVKKITGYQTVEDFKQYLRVSLIADMMFNKLADASVITDIPQVLKDHYYNAYIRDLMDYLASMGLTVSGKEELIAMMGYTEENFDKMVWETLNSAIKYDYIFYRYCEEYNLTLTEEAYQKYLSEYLSRQGSESEEDLITDYQMTKDALYETFLYEVVMEHLYNDAEMVDDTDDATEESDTAGESDADAQS